MTEKKYCPINSHPKSDGMCKKEKCVWWILELGGISIATCSIKVLAENLFFIQGYLGREK